MSPIHIITLLAVLQYFVFGIFVGRARARYGVKAPAMSGHEMFERAMRIHINTLEQLAGFIPTMFIAAQYWSEHLIAGIGAVYLVGRLIYWRSYMSDPSKRRLGFILTVLPTFIFIGLGLYGAIKSL